MDKAKRTARKRLKRERRVAGKNKLVPVKFQIPGIARWKLTRMIQSNKDKSATKKKKQARVIKPYRITHVQRAVEKLEAGVRGLDHADPNRQKMLNSLAEKRRLLGNKTYELTEIEK